MSQHWLIVEDALKNRKGHWLEYVLTFREGLAALGHEVTVLAERSAEKHIAELDGVQCVLPTSIWERMGDGAGRMSRYARVPSHGWKTYRTLSHWFSTNASPDIVFVPTVLVHHLLGWWRLYQSTLRKTDSRLLLFFPNTPLTLDVQTGLGVLGSDPTARLFDWLIKQFAEGVDSGKVILGVETNAMREAMTNATGVPFTYLPHPVRGSSELADRSTSDAPLHFGCYGAARHEKGSDLLQNAIRSHLERHPESESKFSIQWLEDFCDEQGKRITIDEGLALDPRVSYIREYFREGGYEDQLLSTDVMLLPYREPYRYRVSRVVIESIVQGMPVVATRQTTLWEQAEEFGVGLPCELNDSNSLAQAIQQIEINPGQFLNLAKDRASLAQRHFSVENFASMVEKKMKIPSV